MVRFTQQKRTMPPPDYNFSILRDLRKRAGLTIDDVSHRSSVSPAVISRIERNRANAELPTLFRLSRVFNMTAADLVALAESRTSQQIRETDYSNSGFEFRRIEFRNSRCMIGEAKAGSTVSRPDIHSEDYEIVWVLEGEVLAEVAGERHVLSAGDALQFDAVLTHRYTANSDCRIIVQHIAKDKRF